MSYSRFGGSDVYVFMSTSGSLECCGCILQEREWVDDPEYPIFGGYLTAVGEEVEDRFGSTQEMVDHLGLHRRAGHCIPDHIEASLWADDPENFPTDCADGHEWGEPYQPYPSTKVHRVNCKRCGWVGTLGHPDAARALRGAS